MLQKRQKHYRNSSFLCVKSIYSSYDNFKNNIGKSGFSCRHLIFKSYSNATDVFYLKHINSSKGLKGAHALSTISKLFLYILRKYKISSRCSIQLELYYN